MARILLADADAATRAALSNLLEEERHAVLLATSPLQLTSAVMRREFELAIVDLALLRRAQDAVPGLVGTPVIAVAPSDGVRSPSPISLAAWLFRPIDVEAARVFVAAALSTEGTSPSLASELRGPQALLVRPHLREVQVGSAMVKVTPSELAILVRLLRFRGSPVPVEDIAREVWPDELASRNVIEAHISRSRRKLRAAGAPDAIQTVRGLGYQIPDSYQGRRRAEGSSEEG